MLGTFAFSRLETRARYTRYATNYYWVEDYVEQRGPIVEFKTKLHGLGDPLFEEKVTTCIIPLRLLVKAGLIKFNQRNFTYQFTGKELRTVYFVGFEDKDSGDFLVEEIGALRLNEHEVIARVDFDKVTTEEAFWAKVESHFDKFLVIFLLIIVCVMLSRG